MTPSFSHEAPQESNGRRAEASIRRFLVPVDRSHDMGGVESDAAQGMDSPSVAFVGFPDSDGESKADSEADSEADSDENSDESSKADRADLGTLHPAP